MNNLDKFLKWFGIAVIILLSVAGIEKYYSTVILGGLIYTSWFNFSAATLGLIAFLVAAFVLAKALFKTKY